MTQSGTGAGYSTLGQRIGAEPYRGKRVRLTGSLRKTAGAGPVLLFLQISPPAGQEPQVVTGSPAAADWRADSLLVDIPQDAASLTLGLAQAQPGEAWLDGVQIEILGPAGLGDEPPRPLSRRGTRNLAALGKLVANLRYFYPGASASRLDWPTWTLAAVGPVEDAKSDAELRRVFRRLVRPIAPEVRFFRLGDPPPRLAVPKSGSQRIAWRHYGLGTGTPRSAGKFRSRLVTRTTQPEGAGSLSWISGALALRGDTLRFAASTRLDRGADPTTRAELWIRTVDGSGRVLAEQKHEVEAAEGYRENALSLAIPDRSIRISVGARLLGGGRLFLDRVRVTAESGSAGAVPVLIDGFEGGAPGEPPPGWLWAPASRAGGYRVAISGETAAEGHRAARLSSGLDVALPDPGKPLEVDLGGVGMRFPLALWRDAEAGAAEPPAAPWVARKPAGFFPSGRDRATRLADVLVLWAALDRFYPYRLSGDWAASLERALRSASMDRDERAFLETLRRLLAGLRDNHATVSHASDTAEYRLPLLWRVFGGRLVVTWVDPSAAPVLPGDIVERVDGIAASRALARMESLVSAATPAHRRYRALERLASAAKDSVRKLELRRGSRRFAVALHATAPLAGPDRLRGARPEKIAELAPGLFYLDLDRIDDDDFVAALPRLTRATGLIFDLRGYPERISEILLGHLLSAPAKMPGTWTALRTRPDRPPTLDPLAGWIQPVSPHLGARVVFLADERAYSRAETWLDVVSFYRLGKIVGSTTGGTNGEVDDLELPGGYTVTWTGNRARRLDGREIQGVGIPPDVAVAPSFAGVLEGRDEVLERAMALFGR